MMSVKVDSVSYTNKPKLLNLGEREKCWATTVDKKNRETMLFS